AIRNLRLQNTSLLMMNGEDQALWKEVFQCKYGQTSTCYKNMVTNTYGIGIWKPVRALWTNLEVNTCIKEGNGTRLFFWTEAWNGQSAIKDSYPDLFLLCNNP
ncbi:hypothetical protein EJD97_023158, partial [Solanum chilense]